MVLLQLEKMPVHLKRARLNDHAFRLFELQNLLPDAAPKPLLTAYVKDLPR